MKNRIGVLGLGLLGGAISERLSERDWSVLGFDIAPDRCESAATVNIQVANDSAEVVRWSQTVLLCLPTGQSVAKLLAEIGQEFAGHLVIDTTTALPEESESFARILAERESMYVDATVAGSSRQARAGEVLVLAGGDEEPVARAKTVLNNFAAQVMHVGPHGYGSRYKLIHNLMLGLSRAALAESLALANILGVDKQKALEVLQQSPATYARVMDVKGQKMIEQDFTPQATVRQHLKDVRLMLQEAKQAATPLPLSTVHAQLLQSLMDRDLGELDNSAIVRAYENGDA